MIKKVKIKNFQSHSDSELEFDEGVNIIVGTSNKGKSAILRAIKWNLFNKPSGTDFIKWDESDCSVSLLVDDKEIERKRTKSKNVYSYENNEYAALRSSVPEDIRAVLNISDLNVKNQLDNPFLLSDSAGQVAKTFNQIANLDKIDTTLRNINQIKKENSKEIEFLENNLTEIGIDLEGFKYLPIFERRLNYLLNLNQELENKEKKLETTERIIKEFNEVSNKERELESLCSLNSLLQDIKSLKEQLKQDKNRSLEMENFIEKYQIKNKAFLGVSETFQLTPYIEVIKSLRSDERHLKMQQIFAKTLLEKINDVNRKIKEKEEKINVYQEKIRREFPDTCPLCGGNRKREKGQ